MLKLKYPFLNPVHFPYFAVTYQKPSIVLSLLCRLRRRYFLSVQGTTQRKLWASRNAGKA